MKQIGLRVNDELYAAIEQARGDVPREPWMRRVLAEAAVRSSMQVKAQELSERALEMAPGSDGRSADRSAAQASVASVEDLVPASPRASIQRGSPSPSFARFATPKAKR